MLHTFGVQVKKNPATVDNVVVVQAVPNHSEGEHALCAAATRASPRHSLT